MLTFSSTLYDQIGTNTSNRYDLATNVLYKLIVGGFGSTESYCGNGQIATEEGNPIKEYRKASQTEGYNVSRMARYTLIPEEYFYTQQVK